MDAAQLERDFEAKVPTLERLCEEVLFGLDQAITASGIKLHSLTGRVKTTESFCEKVVRKNYVLPFDETEDLVGTRAVCLFLDDLSKLNEIVADTFDVVSQTDTVNVDPSASFGYSSIHLICTMKREHAGPRYDGLNGLKFEVQLRTLLMDAWANVSHYLAYKGEASIPDALKRDFHALSGLFYVADKHFQLFFEASEHSQASAALQAVEGGLAGLPIDRDTLTAYVQTSMADRLHDDPLNDDTLSALAEELTQAGLETIGDLEDMMARGKAAAQASEAEHPPMERSGYRYNAPGYIRVTMDIMYPEVRQTELFERTYGHLVTPPGD